jgi:DNA-binding MarR family transcriptional regulator
MPQQSSETEAVEFARLLHRMISLRPRLEALLPKRLVEFKARLEQTRPVGKGGKAADYKLLFTIGTLLTRQAEPVTMGELSREMGVPLSTATRIVDWLVNSNLAERLPDPTDRRIVRVAISPNGMEIYRISLVLMSEQIEKWWGGFSPEEKMMLVSLMRKFIEAMETG